MSEEPTIRIPSWIKPIIVALVSALLGSNLFQSVAANKELTREAAKWDTQVAEIILAKLDRIEARLDDRP
jgi:hypothetical protein